MLLKNTKRLTSICKNVKKTWHTSRFQAITWRQPNPTYVLCKPRTICRRFCASGAKSGERKKLHYWIYFFSIFPSENNNQSRIHLKKQRAKLCVRCKRLKKIAQSLFFHLYRKYFHLKPKNVFVCWFLGTWFAQKALPVKVDAADCKFFHYTNMQEGVIGTFTVELEANSKLQNLWGFKFQYLYSGHNMFLS